MRRPRSQGRGSRCGSAQVMVLIGQAGGVAPVGLAQRGHQQRGVGHAACERPGHTAHVGRLDGHPAGAGLEAHHAAPGGRQPDGAADVGAQVQRAVARGSGGRRAGTAAAGVLAQVPGVAREGPAARGSCSGPTTTCRSRASWSCPAAPRRLRAAARPVARLRSRHQLGGRGAQRQRQAARGDVLLQRERHAVQWSQRLVALPARLGGACRLGQCGVGRSSAQVACRCGSQRAMCASHIACSTSTGRQLGCGRAGPVRPRSARAGRCMPGRAAGVRPCPGSAAGWPPPCA
jgi:hypothetical protein